MRSIPFLILLACSEEPSEKIETEPTDVVDTEPSTEPCDTEVYYMDADVDGFGNPLLAMESCDPIEGYVQNNADCNDDNAEEFPGQTWYLDADGDGFGSATDTLIQCAHPVAYVRNADDCDDMDGTRNPTSMWYLDADQDGYGDRASEVESCSDVSTAVPNDQDCDDDNSAIHPLANEVCDFIDNDCDGLMDNEDPTLNAYGEVALYTDLDGDGFGTDEYVTHACPSSPLGSPIVGDCNDGDAEVYPGAFEWPDSVDSNCDDEPYFQSSDYFSEGYTYDSERSLGSSMLYQDLDGDGISDVILGEIVDNNDTGKVFWVSGTQTADFSVLDSSTFTWTGANEGDEFGAAMLVVDDLTNDGVAELIVGAPGTGTVYLLDGSMPGTTSDALWSWSSTTGTSSDFGRSIVSLGDVDGDGSTEFVVSDSSHDGTKSNQGAVFVLSSSDVGALSDPVDAVFVLGDGSSDLFGFDVANIDDVDGDGIVDVIVSATKNGPVNPGITYLMSATDLVTGLVDLQTAISFEGMSYQQAGTSLGGVGDFNGDGYKDFAVKAGSIWGSSTELGTLYLVHGKSIFGQNNLLEDAEVQIDSTATANEFGDQILAAGDLNVDGYDDLVFANPLSEYPLSASNNNHGVVFGVYGGTYTGTFTTVDVAEFALTGPENWTNFGTNLLSAGDIDTDGIPDFWISSRYGLYLFNGSTLNPQ